MLISDLMPAYHTMSVVNPACSACTLGFMCTWCATFPYLINVAPICEMVLQNSVGILEFNVLKLVVENGLTFFYFKCLLFSNSSALEAGFVVL
jgi:hypothetical protein